MLAYVSVTGVYLYRWYQMGITDPKDLMWLIDFYRHERWTSENLIMAAMMTAKTFIEGREND